MNADERGSEEIAKIARIAKIAEIENLVYPPISRAVFLGAARMMAEFSLPPLPPFLRVSRYWFFLISVHPRLSAVSFWCDPFPLQS